MSIKKICVFAILTLVIFCSVPVVKAVNDSDIDNKTYANYSKSTSSCGKNSSGEYLMTDIPKSIPKLTHRIYLGLLIAVPVVLVILGMIDVFKGLSAQKDEEIKKGQQILVKRLISAGIIFLVLLIVKLVIGFAADSNSSRIVSCMECFIDANCK